ncbi:MAG: aminotransferase class I/II-fold pyridoxal phosphate-dependent enzyme, partial [Nostoc sp.]
DLVFGESGEWGVGSGEQENFSPNPKSKIVRLSGAEVQNRSTERSRSPKSLVPSILQADPDKSVSIEFFTLSKSYNMGGFRIGYAIGNAQLINALRQVKAAVDFNQYRGILNGAIAALTGPQSGVKSAVATFQGRRDAFISA